MLGTHTHTHTHTLTHSLIDIQTDHVEDQIGGSEKWISNGSLFSETTMN